MSMTIKRDALKYTCRFVCVYEETKKSVSSGGDTIYIHRQVKINKTHRCFVSLFPVKKCMKMWVNASPHIVHLYWLYSYIKVFFNLCRLLRDCIQCIFVHALHNGTTFARPFFVSLLSKWLGYLEKNINALKETIQKNWKCIHKWCHWNIIPTHLHKHNILQYTSEKETNNKQINY